MANRTQRSFGILTALCLVAALGAWSCEQAGGTVGTPAGPSSATAAAKSGGSTPAATPTPSSAPAPTPASKTPPPSLEDLTAALEEAIQDEYLAFFTYTRVVNDLGYDKPFGRIAEAEQHHIDALTKQFEKYEKYGLRLPDIEASLDNVISYPNLTAACEAGVEAERYNIAMYDRLLLLELPAGVVNTFETLRAASENNHLPTFLECKGKNK